MNDKINIMISSRSVNNFPATSEGRSLSDIRRDVKEKLESIKLLGNQLFEVWIFEENPPMEGTWDSWEVCMNAISQCHIFIALYNGHAGSANNSGENGFCFDELEHALNQTPNKVRLINLGITAKAKDDEVERNERFQKFVNDQAIFYGKQVNDEKELFSIINKAIYDALIKLADAGKFEGSRGRFHSGDPLNWSRLNYQQRHNKMVAVLTDAINRRGHTEENHLFVRLFDRDILFIPDAIPDSMSISQAKEMVGQPFLKDHMYSEILQGNKGGPVHIIACQKSATESQAKKLLGFPDATVVSAPFGIYVADNIQKIQFVLIADCRDETSTRSGVQRFFEWMRQNKEDVRLSKRAWGRARIINEIAAGIEE